MTDKRMMSSDDAKKLLKERDPPENIVCMFEAKVQVTVENIVYGENAARTILVNHPELWKLSSLCRKKKQISQDKSALS